jgi:hypothetical protein
MEACPSRVRGGESMANPFPGIDPYVEAQKFWRDFHTRFLTYSCDAINERVPSRYRAVLEEQFTIATLTSDGDEEVGPDVVILRDDAATAGPPRHATPGVLAEPVTIPLPKIVTEQVTERWIEIQRGEDRSVVAVIELLSPTNKSGSGLNDYLARRRRLIGEPVHLIELDFLIGGRRLPMSRRLPEGHFYALVSRASRRPYSEVYAWTIRQNLPTIPIPLDPPDPDILLDLASLYATAYERGPSSLLRRDHPLKLPFSAEDRAWAEVLSRLVRGA